MYYWRREIIEQTRATTRTLSARENAPLEDFSKEDLEELKKELVFEDWAQFGLTWEPSIPAIKDREEPAVDQTTLDLPQAGYDPCSVAAGKLRKLIMTAKRNPDRGG